ncbi:hypothetical protein D9M70_501750 [compost metagenome]
MSQRGRDIGVAQQLPGHPRRRLGRQNGGFLQGKLNLPLEGAAPRRIVPAGINAANLYAWRLVGAILAE